MNDFTKEELQYFLMTIKPFHFLWQEDPLKLEEKIQAMIDNYCKHEFIFTLHDSQVHCHKCNRGLNED